MVIGRGGRDIPRERAYEHVFGYTVINDFSACKLAHHDEYDTDPDNRPGYFAWLIGKWQDGYCPAGPWVVHRSALRRRLAILDKAERTIESVTRERDDLLERVPGA